jgi:hypothetical protein
MKKNSIKFNIDFCSNTKITGWFYDESRKSFPEVIDCRSGCGKVIIVDNSFLLDRHDINKKFNLSNDKQLGFSINLKDLFNGVVQDYELYVDNIKQWSFNDYLQKLDDLTLLQNDKFELVKTFGLKQIVVIYQDKSFLHNFLEKIHCWLKDYFNKNNHGGVSFCFIEIAKLTDIKDKLLKSSNELIIFIEKKNLRSIYSLSPSLLTENSIMLIDDHINLNSDWNGLLSVACSYANLKHEEILTASKLLRLLTVFSNYADLFFDSKTQLYSYQSGQIQHWMKNVMREKVQGRFNEDVVVLSNESVSRFQQLNENEFTTFVRVGSLRFLLDIVPLSSFGFIKEALRRGARVRIIKEGQL